MFIIVENEVWIILNTSEQTRARRDYKIFEVAEHVRDCKAVFQQVVFAFLHKRTQKNTKEHIVHWNDDFARPLNMSQNYNWIASSARKIESCSAALCSTEFPNHLLPYSTNYAGCRIDFPQKKSCMILRGKVSPLWWKTAMRWTSA